LALLPEIAEVSGTLIDLDKYRAERVADGTWPPDQLTVRDYWKSRKPGKNVTYDKPKPGGAA
jgi:hypothetical protein